MSLSRRTILKGAGALPLLAGSFGPFGIGADRPAARWAAGIPPVLFVHGNGDHAALWITTLWRMEIERRAARPDGSRINFTDPLARTDDTVEQPNRSSTEAAAPRTRRRRRGTEAPHRRRRASHWSAVRAAAIRSAIYIKNGGGADISHAVLCGVPNHGIYRLGRQSGQRVQRPRPVPARA